LKENIETVAKNLQELKEEFEGSDDEDEDEDDKEESEDEVTDITPTPTITMTNATPMNKTYPIN